MISRRDDRPSEMVSARDKGGDGCPEKGYAIAEGVRASKRRYTFGVVIRRGNGRDADVFR